MYGWICGSMEDMVLSHYGEETWLEILNQSGVKVEKGEFFHSIDFPEDCIYRLVDCFCKMKGVAERDVMFAFGVHFALYIAKCGLEKILLCSSTSMREWIHKIGEPHRLMRIKFPTANLPDFRVEPDRDDPNLVILHYYSTRSVFFEPLVEGLCYQMAQSYFSCKIDMEILVSEQIDALHHCSWLVRGLEPIELCHSPTVLPPNMPSKPTQLPEDMPLKCPFSAKLDEMKQSRTSPVAAPSAPQPRNDGVGISAHHLQKIFPFHLTIDRNLVIIQAGQKLESMFRDQFQLPLIGQPVQEIFEISPEGYRWSWHQLLSIEGQIIALICPKTDPLLRLSGEFMVQEPIPVNGCFYSQSTITFLIRPDIYRIEEMKALKLNFNDFPPHSFQRDIIVAGETLKSEIDYASRMAHMSRELAQQSHYVKQALKTKQVFVRYVSHEIRTPLNIAVLGMDYLEEKLNLADEQKGAIGDTMEEIKLSCSIAVEILNDFLLYEKLDDGIFNLSLSRVFFAPIIDESHKLFDLQAKSANITFTTDLSCPYVRHTEILVDRKKFYQVLRNLLSNAIKFTPEGGAVTLTACVIKVAEKSSGYPAGDSSWWQMLDGHPIYFAAEPPRYSVTTDSALSSASTPHATTSSQSKRDKGSGILASKASFAGAVPLPPESLTISTTPAEPDVPNSQGSQMTSSSMTMVFDVPKIDDCPAFLRIIVSDTGAGIDVADQKNLFHQFIQVQPDKLQQGQGSGLGLWIAANITRMHGGRIGVMSAGEGRGAHFVLDMPMVNTVTATRSPRAAVAAASSMALLNESSYTLNPDEAMLRSASMATMDSSIGEVTLRSNSGSLSFGPTTTATTLNSGRLELLASDSGPSNQSQHSGLDGVLQGFPDQQSDSCAASFVSNHSEMTEPGSCAVPKLPLDMALTAYPGLPAMLLSFLPQALVPLFEDEALWHPLRSITLQEARVLVVDDSSSNRKMMRRILSERFTDLDDAENGQVALDKYMASFGAPPPLAAAGSSEISAHDATSTSSSHSSTLPRQRPYDIIFMDGVMPVMDGLAASQAIRAHQFEQLKQQLQQLQSSSTWTPLTPHTPHTPFASSPSSSSGPLWRQESAETRSTRSGSVASVGSSMLPPPPPLLTPSSGSTTARRPLFHRTLILGVTGNGQDEDMKRFIDAGADHVFVKPLKMAQLLSYLNYFFLTNAT